MFPSKYFSIQFINYPVFFLLAADFSQSTGTQLWHNFLVMIQTLKKDFSRFEEIQILRTVSVEEQKQAPVVKKLDREIKRTLRKKRKESYSIIFYHIGSKTIYSYQSLKWLKISITCFISEVVHFLGPKLWDSPKFERNFSYQSFFTEKVTDFKARRKARLENLTSRDT